MNIHRTGWLIPVVLSALAACGEHPGPSDPAAVVLWGDVSADPTHANLAAMTRNAYLGASFGPLIQAQTEEEVIAAASAAWAQVLANDFPSRAEALAWEIHRRAPDFVGLQETALFQVSGPGAPGGLVLDYLQLLTDALARYGDRYEVVEVNDNLHVTVPAITAGGLIFIEFTDRTAALVRRGVDVLASSSHHFTLNAPVTIAGQPFFLLRGWNQVRASVNGSEVVFVNSHLETDEVSVPLQNAQALELMGVLAAEAGPVVLVGDLNARADGTAELGGPNPTYDILTDAGFADAWAAVGMGGEGLTCCHDGDLMNPTVSLHERIDYVLARGPELAFRAAWLSGDEASHRATGGLWPSDHLGLAAGMAFADGVVAVN